MVECNKISLNVEKTKLVISISPREVLSDVIKIKFSGKKLYPSNSVRYLGVRIVKCLHWHDQVNNTANKPNRANEFLLKIKNYKNYVKMNTLTNIYFAIFDSHLSIPAFFKIKTLIQLINSLFFTTKHYKS